MQRTVVKTNEVTSHALRGRMLPAAILLTFFLIKPVTMAQHGSNRGIVTPTSRVKWEQDSDVKCLTSALEKGDPNTGASTFILKATPGCKVPWHYHSAEEQLIVVHGHLMTEMESMTATPLDDGGFAMMPSKVKHQFSCGAKEGCLLFVTFDRAYDIFWVSQGK
jgi:quercetin dioxygenase-like cupin family protein